MTIVITSLVLSVDSHWQCLLMSATCSVLKYGLKSRQNSSQLKNNRRISMVNSFLGSTYFSIDFAPRIFNQKWIHHIRVFGLSFVIALLLRQAQIATGHRARGTRHRPRSWASFPFVDIQLYDIHLYYIRRGKMVVVPTLRKNFSIGYSHNLQSRRSSDWHSHHSIFLSLKV
jgi:hypothetical protein